tara:strand:- start:2928 stop:4424 length:1497 start_codon:yes stop_codon:yes gene_type:complete
MKKKSLSIVWFKKDLRTHDHEPLYLASKEANVACIYIYEDELINQEHYTYRQIHFLNESLKHLDSDLKDIGSRLNLFRGDIESVFNSINQNFNIEKIFSHQETGELKSFSRDRRAATLFKSQSIIWNESQSNGVFRGLKNRDDWTKKWNAYMFKERIHNPVIKHCVLLDNTVPIQTPRDFNKRDGLMPVNAGFKNALLNLNTFLDERSVSYSSEMSSPNTAYLSCSRLSANLSHGNISLREIFQRTNEKRKNLREQKVRNGHLKSLAAFSSRLHWHCHFIQKLETQPSLEYQNMVRAFDGMREDDFNPKNFDLWKNGMTGYPLVDACMRALRKEGWINFRMRAMIVSFASYNLWLDWKKTSKVLAAYFTDYEPGIHYNQIQMQSGVTGINTIRIYNPTKQLLDQDPKGEFVRKWCPELKNVPDDFLAQPFMLPEAAQKKYNCIIGKDYPSISVDLLKSSKLARERIYAIKRLPDTRSQSAAAYDLHGSRKKSRNKYRS